MVNIWCPRGTAPPRMYPLDMFCPRVPPRRNMIYRYISQLLIPICRIGGRRLGRVWVRYTYRHKSPNHISTEGLISEKVTNTFKMDPPPRYIDEKDAPAFAFPKYLPLEEAVWANTSSIFMNSQRHISPTSPFPLSSPIQPDIENIKKCTPWMRYRSLNWFF